MRRRWRRTGVRRRRRREKKTKEIWQEDEKR